MADLLDHDAAREWAIRLEVRSDIHPSSDEANVGRCYLDAMARTKRAEAGTVEALEIMAKRIVERDKARANLKEAESQVRGALGVAEKIATRLEGAITHLRAVLDVAPEPDYSAEMDRCSEAIMAAHKFLDDMDAELSDGKK